MNRVEYGNWVPGAVVRFYRKRRGVCHYGIAGPLEMVGMPTVFQAKKCPRPQSYAQLTQNIRALVRNTTPDRSATLTLHNCFCWKSQRRVGSVAFSSEGL